MTMEAALAWAGPPWVDAGEDDLTAAIVRVGGMGNTRRPSFSEEFPRTPELDAVVAAFALGDYASVRAQAIRLERSSPDETVRKAARMLFDRTRPDPLSIGLLVAAALLLVTMAGWWVVHGKPPS